MPFTIVLTPPEAAARRYTQLSQDLYRDCSPNYLLSPDGTSSPHITVVQFASDSEELVRTVWSTFLSMIQREPTSVPFSPPFSGVAFVDGEGSYAGTTWVELSVKRGNVDSPIMRLHNAAVEALSRHGLEPLNACGSSYRPHLTLSRIVMPDQLRVWPKDLCTHPEPFKLELGVSDERWQYAKTLAVFPPVITESLSALSELHFRALEGVPLSVPTHE